MEALGETEQDAHGEQADHHDSLRFAMTHENLPRRHPCPNPDTSISERRLRW